MIGGVTSCLAGGTLNASIALERLSVNKAVDGIRLVCDLSVHSSPPAREGIPHGFLGRGWLDAGRGMRFLGEFHPDRTVYLVKGGYSGRFSAGCHLSQEGLESIEDIREGGTFRLLVDYEFIALTDGTPIGGGQASFAVGEDQWAAVLENAGVADRMLLLLAKPSPHADARVRDAWERWREARRAIDGSRWRDAVAECRHALDRLDLPKPPKDIRQRDKEQRWHALAQELENLTSAAHHSDPVTHQMDWSRDDAIGAVVILGGILRSVSSERTG